MLIPFAPVTLNAKGVLVAPKEDTGCATVVLARAECVFRFNTHFLGYVKMGGGGKYGKVRKRRRQEATYRDRAETHE